jgi:hypothetical protein
MLEIQLKVKINGGKVSLNGFVDAANVRLSNAWSSSHCHRSSRPRVTSDELIGRVEQWRVAGFA